ncbi:MAG: hypothetical protein PHS47_03690 [Methanocellales archaeon]|nr:hypothetical protein [Methanocellales archaeon]MDD3421385.1 hypothetical protein [Methanocellales archaeon]MDD5446284.1 hypothetical protein [Methanocellales archaeon]
MDIKERLEALRSLGNVPESVLQTNIYGLSKLESGWHIDNLDSIFESIDNIDGKDENYLKLSKAIIDSLQLAVFEIDDELDHLEKQSINEILSSETMKIVNPARFYDRILEEAEKQPQILNRIIKSGRSYAREIGILAYTPAQYVKNSEAYNESREKNIEIKKLTDTQILRGSHLKVYFYSTIYLVDPNPNEKELENLAHLIECTRGIGDLIKDLHDLENDIKMGIYNPVHLIINKYKSSLELEKIIKEDVQSVGRLLFEYINSTKINDSKYLISANGIKNRAANKLESLEEKLYEFILRV